MVHIEDVLLHAIAQRGDRYVFGAENKPTDPDPSKHDCSELVEWACARAGVTPTVPDGAVNQYAHCRTHGLLIPVAKARTTRGALLFSGPGFAGGRKGRDAIHHVGISLGDNTTIEARGTKWGVGTWSIGDRFTFAGLIPGVDYTTSRRPLPAAPRPKEDDDVIGFDRTDDRKAFIANLYVTHMGRFPKEHEYKSRLQNLDDRGSLFVVQDVAGSQEAVDYRKANRNP